MAAESLHRALNFFAGDAALAAYPAKLSAGAAAKRLRIEEKERLEYSQQPSAPATQRPPPALGPVVEPSPSSSSIVSPPAPAGELAKSQFDHLVFKEKSRHLRAPAVSHPEWELRRVIAGHQGWVRALALDPSNDWFASGGNDRLIKIWDVARGTLKLTLTGHINNIRALEVSTRSPYLFSAGDDHMVKCWDLEYNKVVRSYHGHLSGVYCLALHPSLDVLATGGRDAVVRLWDIRTKRQIHILSGHSGTVMSLAAQRAEPQLISGSLDKMIRLWDLRAAKCSTVLTHHKKSIRALCVHPTEYTFLSGAADHLKVWRCPLGHFERNLQALNEIVNCVEIQDVPDSAVAIAGTDNGQLHFFDWNSGRKFQSIDVTPAAGSLSSERAIFACKLDMSHTRLFTAECDKTIKVWGPKMAA